MSTGEIILAGDESIVKSNPDIELARLLDENGMSLEDSVKEMKSLLDDAKEMKGAEALKVRVDLLKHTQALHGSKASLKNIQVGVFIHPGVGERLNY